MAKKLPAVAIAIATALSLSHERKVCLVPPSRAAGQQQKMMAVVVAVVEKRRVGKWFLYSNRLIIFRREKSTKGTEVEVEEEAAIMTAVRRRRGPT